MSEEELIEELQQLVSSRQSMSLTYYEAMQYLSRNNDDPETAYRDFCDDEDLEY